MARENNIVALYKDSDRIMLDRSLSASPGTRCGVCLYSILLHGLM